MKPKTKTVLFIVLSFALGILLGGFLERQGFGGLVASETPSQGDFHKVLVERLQLEPQQITQVDSILGIHKERVDALRKQILSIRDTTRHEIRKLLTPEQSKRFDAFIQELNEREAKKKEHEQAKK